MKIEQRKTSDLIPYEQNPRMNDAAVAAVAKTATRESDGLTFNECIHA